MSVSTGTRPTGAQSAQAGHPDQSLPGPLFERLFSPFGRRLWKTLRRTPSENGKQDFFTRLRDLSQKCICFFSQVRHFHGQQCPVPAQKSVCHRAARPGVLVNTRRPQKAARICLDLSGSARLLPALPAPAQGQSSDTFFRALHPGGAPSTDQLSCAAQHVSPSFPERPDARCSADAQDATRLPALFLLWCMHPAAHSRGAPVPCSPFSLPGCPCRNRAERPLPSNNAQVQYIL